MNYFFTFVTFSTFLTVIHGATFPKKWERCHVSPETDFKRNKCIENTMTNIIKDLADNGNEELGMKDLDPFKVNHMVIGQSNPNSPVKISIDYKNLELFGFKEIVIKHASGKVSSAKDFFLKFECHLPSATLRSDYTIDGSILILPITGSGKCNITFDKLIATSEIYAQPQIIDGKEYLKVTNHTLSFNIKKMTSYMDNLFNGNKILGDNMNKVMNDNWELLYKELKPSMESQLDKKFSKYGRKILENIEYKEMFLSE